MIYSSNSQNQQAVLQNLFLFVVCSSWSVKLRHHTPLLTKHGTHTFQVAILLSIALFFFLFFLVLFFSPFLLLILCWGEQKKKVKKKKYTCQRVFLFLHLFLLSEDYGLYSTSSDTVFYILWDVSCSNSSELHGISLLNFNNKKEKNLPNKKNLMEAKLIKLLLFRPFIFSICVKLDLCKGQHNERYAI